MAYQSVARNFFAGRQAAIDENTTAQTNAFNALRLQQMQRQNALAGNPNATPEDYIRAGDPQTGAALQSNQDRAQTDKQQAFQRAGAIAQRALTFPDEQSRKNFLQQVLPAYSQDFATLGANVQQGLPQMLAMPDQELQQKLQQFAALAAPEKPIEVAAGASLATRAPGGGYQSVFTAPKDTSVTPYQQQQLDMDKQRLALERERLTQGNKNNAIQLQNVAGKLRDDYTQIVGKTGWYDQQGFYQRLKAVANDATGASDLALVFSYMKVLDPTSAVREGEYATAQNSGGIPDYLISTYNKALNGQKLAPEQRQKFIAAADKIYNTSLKRQDAIRKDFAGKAERAGVNPQDVLVDFGAPPAAAEQPQAEVTATGPNGQKLVLRNGQWVPQ